MREISIYVTHGCPCLMYYLCNLNNIMGFNKLVNAINATTLFLNAQSAISVPIVLQFIRRCYLFDSTFGTKLVHDDLYAHFLL